MNIMICGKSFPDVAEYLTSALEGRLDFRVKTWSRDLAKPPEGVDVVIPLMETIDADLLRLVRPRLVQQWGSGLERVDLDAARALRIPVANVAATGGNADSVAEHAILLALALLRRLNLAQANVYNEKLGTPVGRTIASCTACVFGLGAVALPLARLLKAFGVRLVGLTRDPSAAKIADYRLDDCFSFSDRGACLGQTDILFVCARQSQTNAGMIGEDELRMLPKGALVVNVARGGLLDYEAVRKCLDDGHLGGLGLDVFWKEPFDGDDAILRAANVVATPHIAGITVDSMRDIAAGVAENILNLSSGTDLTNRAA